MKLPSVEEGKESARNRLSLECVFQSMEGAKSSPENKISVKS